MRLMHVLDADRLLCSTGGTARSEHPLAPRTQACQSRSVLQHSGWCGHRGMGKQLFEVMVKESAHQNCCHCLLFVWLHSSFCWCYWFDSCSQLSVKWVIFYSKFHWTEKEALDFLVCCYFRGLVYLQVLWLLSGSLKAVVRCLLQDTASNNHFTECYVCYMEDIKEASQNFTVILLFFFVDTSLAIKCMLLTFHPVISIKEKNLAFYMGCWIRFCTVSAVKWAPVKCIFLLNMDVTGCYIYFYVFQKPFYVLCFCFFFPF